MQRLLAYRRSFSTPRLEIKLDKMLKSCQDCRLHDGKNLGAAMAPLPPGRTAAGVSHGTRGTLPFNEVNIDIMTDNIMVSDTYNKRKTRLCYLCLFVDQTSRGIHIEP